jgi:hypothetical protein
MPYSKQDILTQNINTYPNNNSGQITPDSVKTFNQNFIDSVQFTDTPTPQAISASYAQNATSASQAARAVTASFVVSASYASTAGTADATPNAFTNANQTSGDNTITLVRGNGLPTTVTIDNVTSASFADNANNAISASYAVTASHALNVPATASYAVSASYAISASIADRVANVDFSTLVTTASFNAYTSSTNAFTASTNLATASLNTFTSSIQAQVNGLQSATSSYVRNAQTSSMSVLSASFATTASFAQNIASGLNITASNIAVTGNETILGNLTVNGTASFAYTKTVTGSAVIIGDEYIILNADTPTAPFAGIIVYDSGSNATASLEWNGNNDYWIAVEESGASAGILTGPSGSKGAEVFPTLNRLTKGSGTNEIRNSNITDTGTLVSINSNTQITGSLSTTGDINIAQTGKLVAHDIQAASVAGVEILNNTSGVVALFGAGGSTGMTLYGQLNATAFSGSGALISGVVSSSYATTSSFATNSSNAVSASYAASASFATTASFAQTASYVNTLNQAVVVSGSINIDGNITGSNVVGNWSDDLSFPKVHQIVTCTQAEYNAVSGSLAAQNTLYIISGSDSFAVSASFAATASYALNAGGATIDTGSLVTTSSFNAYTASINSYTSSLNAATSSFVRNAQTASMSVLSASYADNAGNAVTSLNTTLAQDTFQWNKGGVANNITINNVANATSAGSATSASFADNANNALSATSASYALTASYAMNGGGGAAFPYTGDAVISGSLQINSSVSASNVITNQFDIFTASLAITNVVSCTYDEYLTVSGSTGAQYTLYIVSDGPIPPLPTTTTTTTTTTSTTTTTTTNPIPGTPFVYINPDDSASYPGSGTTVYDLSGNGNNGTLINGVTFNSSGTPDYFDLDGTNDWIGYTDIGDTYGDFTALNWVYFDSLTGFQSIISKWSDTGGQRSWMMVKEENTGLLQAFFDRSGTFSTVRSINASGAAMTTGVWYLCGMTYNATTGDCELFRNNVSQGTATFSGAGNLFNSSSPLQTGAQGEPARYLNGRLGKFLLYKSVLSSGNLTQIWDNTKANYGY